MELPRQGRRRGALRLDQIQENVSASDAGLQAPQRQAGPRSAGQEEAAVRQFVERFQDILRPPVLLQVQLQSLRQVHEERNRTAVGQVHVSRVRNGDTRAHQVLLCHGRVSNRMDDHQGRRGGPFGSHDRR